MTPFPAPLSPAPRAQRAPDGMADAPPDVPAPIAKPSVLLMDESGSAAPVVPAMDGALDDAALPPSWSERALQGARRALDRLIAPERQQALLYWGGAYMAATGALNAVLTWWVLHADRIPFQSIPNPLEPTALASEVWGNVVSGCVVAALGLGAMLLGRPTGGLARRRREAAARAVVTPLQGAAPIRARPPVSAHRAAWNRRVTWGVAVLSLAVQAALVPFWATAQVAAAAFAATSAPQLNTLLTARPPQSTGAPRLMTPSACAVSLDLQNRMRTTMVQGTDRLAPTNALLLNANDLMLFDDGCLSATDLFARRAAAVAATERPDLPTNDWKVLPNPRPTEGAGVLMSFNDLTRPARAYLPLSLPDWVEAEASVLVARHNSLAAPTDPKWFVDFKAWQTVRARLPARAVTAADAHRMPLSADDLSHLIVAAPAAAFDSPTAHTIEAVQRPVPAADLEAPRAQLLRALAAPPPPSDPWQHP